MRKQRAPHKKLSKTPPDGVQFSLDQEVPPAETFDNSELGGGTYIDNLCSKDDISGYPYPPPNPPPSPTEFKPCLFDHPANRETIRNKLRERHITCINLLLRNFTTAELRDALEDFDRAMEEVHRGKLKIRDRTGYFRGLLD